MPSHAARVKSMVDEVVSPSVWLVITMGASVMERVSAPTSPWTIPLLYVMVKDASEPCGTTCSSANSHSTVMDREPAQPALGLSPLVRDG